MHILVVDDQALNRTLLQHMLELEGYAVTLAEDGVQALDLYKQVNPDIVLLDVVMPNLDGYETASQLKALSADVHLPIIFLTALDDEDSLIRCLEVGGDDFLSKPFDKVVLNAKIKAHSRTRQLSQSIIEQNHTLEYHRNLVNREHEIVEHIFNNALAGNIEDTAIDSHISPASMFNGDLLLTSRSPSGATYILMGDFTGHGLAAAVGALPLSRVFYSMSRKGLSISDISAEMNSLLLHLLPDDMFCAAVLIELSSSGKNAAMWAGGMPDVLHIGANGGISRRVNSQHMALGVLEPHEFERRLLHFDLKPNDHLVVYTDGIIEADNESGEMFGQHRLEAMYDTAPCPSVDDVVNTLRDFRGTSNQLDDLSIVSIKVQPFTPPERRLASKRSSLCPFTIQQKLTVEDIRHGDPVTDILDMLSNLEDLVEHRTNIYMLLSELYNNAIDHGLLELSSSIKDEDDGFYDYYTIRQERLNALTTGQIEIQCRFNPSSSALEIEISDSGKGYLQKQNQPTVKVDQLHGRGLGIIAELSDSLQILDGGCTVKVGYTLI